jgi:shikimate dehydrogenase
MKIVLFGNPVAHSVSPAMHNAALAQAGLDGWEYTAEVVEGVRLPEAIERIRGGEYAGANVTVPHKQAVFSLVDGLTPVAQAIGAVNILIKRDGKLIGHNTDAAGFLADLYAHGVRLEQRPVLILGAGGTARAVVAACAGAGARVRVAARQQAQARALQDIAPATIFDWSSLGLLEASDGAALIVNTTPLGMTPRAAASPWPDDLPWPPDAFVYDCVYNPAETRLVRQARAAGLRADTGLGMLVEQGLLGFELWTGRQASRAVMRQAAEEKLFGLTQQEVAGAKPRGRQKETAQ